MVTLAGYENFVQIHDSSNSQVYRAWRVADRRPVIVKFLNRHYPTPEQIRRYKQEYQLTSQLDSPGIVKVYSLEEWQRSLAMVLEDFGGVSLKHWLQERSPVSLSEFLFLAIAITESLGQIHAQQIIHKDINPANIVFNAETQQVKIIDFGIASQLSRENPTLKNPNVLEGTLAYISPEQTGRMNRSLDYRTDFYSLGVTFYELLTGQRPFAAEDALELVHCHIAQSPPPIATVSPSVPSAIAQIAMKLMAKNAEDRYQSAYGLKADLEICDRQLETTGTIESFPLAQQDVSDRLQIHQKLYGREAEISALLAAFERVAETGQVELMLVAGYSGIGKSSLVQELYKPITARRGYFIAGKFDQLQRNIPYSALVSAFSGLMGQLLGESEAALQVWREKLLKALGNNGQVIVDVIPEVELIIGKQPSVPELGANEAQNRFNLVFGNFIHVFCNEEHPLTLFLDDLQWADLATLQLMERLLLEGQTEYLLLLGAYRDNEVPAGHPLAMSLAKLRQNKGQAIAQIALTPLTLDQIAALIGDTLQQGTEKVGELAQLILQKTAGNPFFINEFLQALYDEELLQFDRQSRSWQWDTSAIAARNFTDNVVALMVQKLQKLPPSSQEILSLAACWGAEFDLELLTWVGEKSARETFDLLKIALDRDLIFPLSELDDNLLIQSYKFGHDRIQQAAYTSIPEAQKESLHYRIGRMLLQYCPPEAREEKIFELVAQLNQSISCIVGQAERDELAQLNLIAANKAKSATAYQAGREYVVTALSLLGEDPWQRQYDLALRGYELSAELAFLCGDLETMEQFAARVIARAKSPLERANVYRLKISASASRHRFAEAIAIACGYLRQLGVDLPETPTDADVEEAIAAANALLENRNIEDFAHFPPMTDARQIAIMEIASSIIPASHISSSPLFVLLVSLGVQRSIQYGNTAASAFAYSCYGLMACTILQAVEQGVRFGYLSLAVLKTLDAKTFKPEVLHVVGFFILHRKAHIHTTLPIARSGYVAGLDVGNTEFTGYTAYCYCFNAFWCGNALAELERETQIYCQVLARLNQITTENWCRIYWQSILNLLEEEGQPTLLSGQALQEEEVRSQLVAAGDRLGLFFLALNKLMLSFLFEEREATRNYATELRGYLASSPAPGTLGIPVFYFYDSLAVLATLDAGSNPGEILEQVASNQTLLRERWASYAPMNHQHKVDLVEAEICRVSGRYYEAGDFYDRAISGAKTHQFLHEESLANELAAKFYLEWGREQIARAYMVEAHYCYARWGARAKVKHLEENYSQLLRSPVPKTSIRDSQSLTNSSTRFTTSHTSSNLDTETLMKASQSIVSEIVLSQLLTQLIKVLLENTGAQRGFLILETEGELLIEAEARERGEIEVLQGMPLEFVNADGSSPLLCSAIVNYVIRTHESVVLDDACHEGNFTQQSYIQNFQIESVLCVPLMHQGQLIGIVYLENNLTTGAFTRERVEIVQLLSGQAAIAISNAKLYTEVKQSEQRLQQFLEAIPIAVSVHAPTGQLHHAKLHYANRTAREIIGISIEPETNTEEIAETYQVYRTGTEELYPNEQLPLARSLVGETVRSDDLELRRLGKNIPLEVSSKPIFDDAGNVVYAITAFQDITERKEAEKLLIDYNKSLEKQLALSLENTQLYEASKRFVPDEFLSLLDNKSIVDVKLGDRVEREMTVLFSDIRDFTTISEQMTPAENFAFINEYLGYMEPQIKKYGGFIDKYIGDAIMALFPNSADDAVKGAIAMLEALQVYNERRRNQNLTPIRIGIGLHTGTLMLGTVGGSTRMDGTAIGDSVNLSARVEGLTKTYGVPFLITHQSFIRLRDPFEYDFRFLERVKAKGKTEVVGLLEVFSADPSELRDAKNASKQHFEQGLVQFQKQNFSEAASLFRECLRHHEDDRPARYYLDRCQQNIS